MAAMAAAGSWSATPATSDSKVGSSPATSHEHHSRLAAPTNEVRRRMMYLTYPRVRLPAAKTDARPHATTRGARTRFQLDAANNS